MTGPIRSWSFSKLSDFERCPGYVKLKYIERIPEPERPLPAGKTEHANDRGSRIHDAAEHFVDGTGPFVRELTSFQVEFNHLRDLYANGKVSLEGEWGMDEDWEIAEWNTAWHRSKLDALVHTSETTAVVVDYKSGRKFGNELKHGQQLQLYTVNTLLRYPHLEQATTELWYLDQNDITSMTFTRNQGLRFKLGFEQRGHALTSATEFPFKPSTFACRWCAYGDQGGACKVSAKNKFPGNRK